MDKRISKRIPVSLEAHATWSGITYRAFITGISENGLYIIAPSGEKEFSGRDKTAVKVQFQSSPDHMIEVHCREIWADNDAAAHSTLTIGLEIQNPSGEFKEFYRASFFRIKKEMSHDAIAVVGMACYYPDAPDLKSFWENILARRRAFRRIPDQRLPLSEYYDADPFAPDKTYANRAAVIDGFEFDWVRRGIPKSVVDSSDIAHWLALEVALRAMEDAGYRKGNTPSDRSGVILGNTLTGEHSRSQNMRLRWPYVKKTLMAAAKKKRLSADVIEDLIAAMEVYYKSAFAPITEDTLAGNLSNTIAGRICNFLDLHGGGYTVDGACSSSLIALTTAANALSTGSLDLAVVGGVDISLDTFELVGFAKTNALTQKDMMVYDRHASGFIPGEGAGFVILKRLQSARAHGNYIYAVMRGWGMSSDGKGGMTAPKAQTQALAIRRAYGKAGYDLSETDFIEGHGTGTVVGDKAELEGIAAAMDYEGTSSLRSCGITSLKSLIGHTKAASGIGGFIKTVMAVNRRVIPPTAGFQEPNPVFQEKARQIYAITQGEVRDKSDIIRAGVSGMGFGGINVHVTIESGGEPAKHIAPEIGERELLVSSQDTELFVLSAASRQEMIERLTHLKLVVAGISTAEMTDLSRHLAKDMSHLKPLRLSLVAGTPENLIKCLDHTDQMLSAGPIPEGGILSNPQKDIWIGNSVLRNRVGFLFPGQGSQQLNMGRRLVERYSWARNFLCEAESWLVESGSDKINEHIYRPLDRALEVDQIDDWKALLSDSRIAQPAICMTSVLWIRHLANLGINPLVVGGHSLGELTAFHAAAAFDDKTLLRLSAFRGKVTSAPDDNPGTMAVFACGREKVEALLREIEGYAVIANINGPTQTVISGERSAVEKAIRAGSLLDIKTKYLPVSNAFHSHFMIGAADKLQRHAPISGVLQNTDIKLLSSIDGLEVSKGTDLRTHFSRHVTSQVDFVSLVENIRGMCDILVEAGPGRVLSNLVESISGTDGARCFPVESVAGDDRSLNVFLAAYFVSGGEINWPALFENRLTRPFIPASERLFIDNPCERPFNIPEDAIADAGLNGDSRPVTADAPVFDDSVGLFSSQQIDFIRKMIQKETKNAGVTEYKEHSESEIGSLPLRHLDTTGPKHDTTMTRETVLNPDRILNLASEMTGFPTSSISLDHRLLDNLNLDSIKAGMFVAKAVKLYGGKNLPDPTTMANSSLREIHEQISSHISLSQENINPQEVLKDPKIEPSNVSGSVNWVRNFQIVLEEQPLAAPASFDDVMAAVSIEKRHFMIVSADETDRLSLDMQAILTSSGVPVTLLDYKSLSNCNIHDYYKYGYFIFLLPRGDNTGLLTNNQTHEMATRMHCIGSVIASQKLRTEKPAYVVAQFGNGGFYKSDPNISLTAKGGAAFICSVHLENPGERIRILEFSNSDNAIRILQRMTEELHSDTEFSIAAYDGNFTRHVPMLDIIKSKSFKDRGIQWTGEDVILVTGGAKGITAECALAFAKKTGVKLALVGSTVLTDGNEEIQKVFNRYRENSITYRYYACDISDKACMIDLKKRIEQDLGPITGVIHGAAINKPRRVEQVFLPDALKEIAPKLTGAINICECLKDSPPKLIIGFGSIIGVTGMSGNAWYGFANEMLNLMLQQFARLYASTETITCAFSIWDEVGMGAKMGSMSFLSRMGILPIPKDKGIEHFMQLAFSDSGEKQVIVASRMSGLDTVRKSLLIKPLAARFLEEVLVYEKGVEIESKALLTLERDHYLRDHCFRGTYLFPTVFGIEAMAQAVSAVTDIHNIDCLQMEDVLLSRPIAVEPGISTEIHIYALVEDSIAEDDLIRVKAGITVDQTDFSMNHFEATFILNVRKDLEKFSGRIPETVLDINPAEDLYGHMLFQGGMFQRIKTVHSMNETQCIFESEMAGINAGNSSEFITIDPYFRDTLLQSAQIILPDVVALPIGIDRWEINLTNHKKGIAIAAVDSLRRNNELITANVTAIDKSGNVIERLTGYNGKIIDKVSLAPSVRDLTDPDDWDTAQVNAKLQSYCRNINRMFPILVVRHKDGLHSMTKDQRHPFAMELFQDAYVKLRNLDKSLPEHITVQWTEDGKPFIVESRNICLSCSHDDRLLLCMLGEGPQGCDVEPIIQRSPGYWSDILGTVRRELLEVIRGIDKSEDVAGSRIWCALEALRKATDMHESNLTYDRQIDDCVIFNGGRLAILTFPIKLLRGHKRMVAVTVANRNSDHIQTVKTCKNACSSIDHDKRLFMDRGPQGQSMFAHRFLLGLKANAAVGGGIYFATYFDLIGKMREYALKPIGKYISDDFLKGNFMVTNYSRTDIWGHAANHETIDAHVWVEKIFGYEDSSLILHFDWGKVMPDGTTKPIASSRHQTSWIKVIGHGIVEPVPCPQYFKDFLKDNRLIPSGNYDAATLELPDNAALSNDQLGNILQQYNVLEPTDRVLADIFIDTTREHSNLAQNVYFSNYFSWQGQLRDKYLHSLSAEVYGKMDRRGRFACINSEVTHLREAMPFDSIYISVKLKTLYECGLDLYFEYFKMIPDGGKIKLAYGSHTLAWIYVDDLDNYVTQHIPEAYLKLMVATDHRILPS